MTPLGKINNPRACKAFTDYLTVQGIKNEVTESDGELLICVGETDLETAQALLRDFANNPNQDKYSQASWQVNQPVSGTTQSLGLDKIWRANGPITKLVTLLCLGLYLFSSLGYFNSIFSLLSFKFQLDEFYRLFTPALMHLSILHLVFNLGWWWFLAGKVENHLGGYWLVLVTLATGVLANVAQALLVNTNFAGLSGVTFGLAGFVWMYGQRRVESEVFLPNNVMGFLVIWMALGFADILPIHMANWAHLFGLLTGVLLAYIAANNKKAA